MTTTLTRGGTLFLGTYVAETSHDELLPDGETTARLSLIDTTLAFAVAAANNPSSPLLGLDRDDATGVELCGVRLSPVPVFAALAFGSVTRSSELDDWTTYGAAGASLWGALLNLAAVEGINDESRLFEAWSVGLRVGVALHRTGRYRQDDRGFDGTDIFGTLAATAAGARLLQLDAEECANALAISASEMGGLVSNLGTDVGIMHAGFAARNGFQAASLAKLGIFGARDAIEARQGFGEAIFGPADAALFGIGDELENFGPLADEVRFRRYSSAIEHQRVIETVKSLTKSRSLSPTDVASVRVEGIPPTSEAARFDVPETVDESRRSLRYVLACLIVDGEITPANFTDEALKNADVQKALGEVDVDIVPRWDKRLAEPVPAEASLVLLTTKSGESISGDPMLAAATLSEAELLEKWEVILGAKDSSSWARRTLDAWRTSSETGSTFSILEAVRTA